MRGGGGCGVRGGGDVACGEGGGGGRGGWGSGRLTPPFNGVVKIEVAIGRCCAIKPDNSANQTSSIVAIRSDAMFLSTNFSMHHRRRNDPKIFYSSDSITKIQDWTDSIRHAACEGCILSKNRLDNDWTADVFWRRYYTDSDAVCVFLTIILLYNITSLRSPYSRA